MTNPNLFSYPSTPIVFGRSNSKDQSRSNSKEQGEHYFPNYFPRSGSLQPEQIGFSFSQALVNLPPISNVLFEIWPLFEQNNSLPENQPISHQLNLMLVELTLNHQFKLQLVMWLFYHQLIITIFKQLPHASLIVNNPVHEASIFSQQTNGTYLCNLPPFHQHYFQLANILQYLMNL